jgi:hypothetical protein
MAAMRRVGQALSRLLDVVKGASRLTDDPAVKAALFDATRAVAAAISSLLNAIRNADMNAFAAQMGALRGAMNNLDNAASVRCSLSPSPSPSRYSSPDDASDGGTRCGVDDSGRNDVARGGPAARAVCRKRAARRGACNRGGRALSGGREAQQEGTLFFFSFPFAPLEVFSC